MKTDDELKQEREREWRRDRLNDFLIGVGVLLACGAFTFLLVLIVSLITGDSMCY